MSDVLFVWCADTSHGVLGLPGGVAGYAKGLTIEGVVKEGTSNVDGIASSGE